MTKATISSKATNKNSTVHQQQQTKIAIMTAAKLALSVVFCALAVTSKSSTVVYAAEAEAEQPQNRRLSETAEPSYMKRLFTDLQSRHQLFDETPTEEIKYWFEYAGELQKYFYRFSKSRGKADYFEGRDDSGVVSARFEDVGSTVEYQDFFDKDSAGSDKQYTRMLENCIALGSEARPDTSVGTVWNDWYGDADRCRVLFGINTVGAGRGRTMIWETNPPLIHGELPLPWTSEQETAVTHFERQFAEINHMCETNYLAVKIQVLVCEPIPTEWTNWMDAQVPACGGRPLDASSKSDLEDRPSPIQIVVAASAATADTCHDLKSGFMEKRLQDVVLSPPYLETDAKADDSQFGSDRKKTNPDLFSSDDHDVYVALKWTSLFTIRSVHGFLQASADLAAGATATTSETATAAMSGNGPASPFLIPSFVRMSYVSEENSKVAKWRMHGDFFHPAAWEISKDSFDMVWLPKSLSGGDGVTTSLCDEASESCGQWWAYFTELQMPTSPEVYANEVTPTMVQGGSNFAYMLTDRHRREIVDGLVCRHAAAATEDKDDSKCAALPQAVIPLGDMESFLINFTPNTALGKQHVKGRRPGYCNEAEREADRQRVKDRKQLNDQEDIEKALFDYTIYPAALFHKDATIKAARARDVALQNTADVDVSKGPQVVKSSYYDVTITKPRPPVLGWCQHISRRGLCTLYADYFRTGESDHVKACAEACGYVLDWSKI